jgi:hypothetical protein
MGDAIARKPEAASEPPITTRPVKGYRHLQLARLSVPQFFHLFNQATGASPIVTAISLTSASFRNGTMITFEETPVPASEMAERTNDSQRLPITGDPREE